MKKDTDNETGVYYACDHDENIRKKRFKPRQFI